MSNIPNVWDWLFATTPPTSTRFLIIAFLAGAVTAAVPSTWDRLQLAATWVHEAGHAIVALVAGRNVKGIRVNADASGSTDHVGTVGAGMILTAFAGYPAPVLVAYGIVVGVIAGYYHMVTGIMIIAVALLFPLHRNIRGFWWAFLYLAFSATLLAVSPLWGQMMLFLLAGFLTVATPRTIVGLHRARRYQRMFPEDEPAHSDADSLARMTGVPALAWEGIFFAFTGFLCWQMASSVL